jgi:hypothetical protein
MSLPIHVRFVSTILFLFLAGIAPKRQLFASEPVSAEVRSTLASASEHIRQFAFDGDDQTYFESAGVPEAEDVFSLVLADPVVVKKLTVKTGRPDGSLSLGSGVLEVSSDGESFRELATFADGTAAAEPGERIQTFRIRPTGVPKQPLTIREIVIDSEPGVATFVYPVEIRVDVADAPELKDWAESAARTCERWYGPINEALKSEGHTPPHSIRMVLKNGIDVPAMAGGRQMTGSVRWFKAHPEDVGAMIHELTHIIQSYPSGYKPGWLVEGVADYIRFFSYEPDNIGPINPKTARYDGNYRVSARFLDHVARTYDRNLVRKLNAALRAGSYKDAMFEDLTGKTLSELDEEWRAVLAR